MEKKIMEDGLETKAASFLDGGWVRNKSCQFPSLLTFILSIENQEKQREEKRLNHMNEEINIDVYPSIE